MITQERFFGGSTVFAPGGSGTYPVHPERSRLYVLNVSTTGVEIQLPDARKLRAGGPVAFLRHIGSEAVEIRDADGNSIGTAMPGKLSTLLLVDGATAAGSWAVMTITPASLVASVQHVDGYLLGGAPSGGNALLIWDSQADSWSAGTSAPRGRVDAVGFTLRERGYWVGNDPVGTDSAKIDEYFAGAWTNLTDCPYQPAKAAGFTLRGVGMVFGGTSEDTVASYTRDAWVAKTNLPIGRDQGCAAVIGERGFLFPGNPAAVVGLRYDPITDSYVSIEAAPSFNRAHQCAFTLGGEAYVAGGWDDDVQYADQVDSYDPVAMTWTSRTAIAAGARYDAMGFAANRRGYLGGGFNSSGTPQDGFYEFLNNTWTNKAVLSSAKAKIANQGVALR